MSDWNPEEHYIWIEPNVKYLLTFPHSHKYAPLPWYARPPPRPVKPGPPPDKLRFVSTRRISNAFDSFTPYTQTLADDLDAFAQTFLHALLARGGKDVADVRHLYASFGRTDLHMLKEARESALNTLAGAKNTAQKKAAEAKKEARERREKALGEASLGPEVVMAGEPRNSNDGNASGKVPVADQEHAEGTNEDEAEVEGPVGFYALSEALYKLAKLSVEQAGVEDAVARQGFWRMTVEERKAQARGRAVEQYDGSLKAWAELKESAEMSLRRKAARKAREKAERATMALRDVNKERATVAEDKATGEEKEMDIDEEGQTTNGAVDEHAADGGSSKSRSVNEERISLDGEKVTGSRSVDEAELPPTKRIRLNVA
ncbi:hypothetical protein C8Q76DRAFT_314886 [Earliella scabrosa]|nr:hypothetical protein C8Q76DRAFT_314886 [Earliella scabrosa]